MKASAAKTRIVEVASRLFYEQGYNSTGINQIIEEADIARASLYNHFPSKRDLLTAYITEAEAAWFNGLEAFVAPIKDPRKKLLALFDYRIERQTRSNFGGCQFAKISAEVPQEDTKAFELVSHQRNRLKAYIKGLLKQVEVEKQAVLQGDLLVETLFLLMEGATLTASVYKSADAIKSARKIAEKLI